MHILIALAAVSNSSFSALQTQWLPPKPLFMKLNVDVSCDLPKHRTGLGVVIRNEASHLVCASTEVIHGNLSVYVGKKLTLLGWRICLLMIFLIDVGVCHLYLNKPPCSMVVIDHLYQ